MKKIILAASIAMASVMANAQNNPLSSGTFSIGGSVGISGSSQSTKTGGNTNDGPTTFSFNILPQAQYFLTDRLSIGLGIGYNYYNSKTKAVNNSPESSTTINTFVVAPFARYYKFIGEENRFGFFGQAGVNIGVGGGTNKIGDVSTDRPSVLQVGFGVSPGIIYFPTKRIGLEASLGNIFSVNSNSTTTKSTVSGGDDTVYTYTTYNFLNLSTTSVQFGFNYYFGN